MTAPLPVHVLVSTLNVGGAEQLLRDLLLHFDPARVRPRLLFFKQAGPVGRECIEAGLDAVTQLMPGRMDPLVVPRLARLLRREGARVLLCINHRNSLLLGVPAARLAGVPVVNWHNETFKQYSRPRLTMAARRLAHRGVRCLVAAARGHAEYLREVERLPVHDIRVIYNGVDPARAVSSLSREQARRRFGVPEDALAVAQVAALRPDKGHEVMLQAFVRLALREPRAVLLLAGDGPRRQELEALARSLGIQERCRFLGIVRDIGDVLAAADLVALSSLPRMETLSVAAIEAMFAGLPVVSTRVGFMDEIVIPGETGGLAPPGDPEGLAAALAGLLQDEAGRRRMGEQAAARVAAMCHISVMTGAFEALLGEVARP